VVTERLRVVGYKRVSTEEQAKGGFSLDAQDAKIRGYCELYELDLIHVHEDPGASGKSLDRPGVAEVLGELRRRKDSPDGLVIAKMDRLTRSIGDWVNLINEFFRNERKRLFSVGESIDTRTATGRMVLNMIMMIAEWEREIIGERTKDGMAEKMRRGELCGKVRFGYDLADDLNDGGRRYRLVPNPREQGAIVLLRQWRGEGKTYRDLARLVEDMGIETKEGSRVWRPTTIKRILDRPIG
jgi:DNA invertase Pin-like site-specific DNA recombinase